MFFTSEIEAVTTTDAFQRVSAIDGKHGVHGDLPLVWPIRNATRL